MVDVRVNEVRTCLITTHSVSNIVDCHVELTIYQKETPSTLLLHSGRLGHNFRYREGVESLISSKEELKDPSARVQCSSAYVRDDVKVTITKIRESKSLAETWEVCVKAGKLKQTIKSAISGGRVTNAQLSADLRHCFDAVTQIRASFNGVGILTEVNNNSIQLLTTKPTPGPSKKLNAKAEPFQPSSQTTTPRSSSEDDSRGTTQVTSKVKEAPSPETTSLGIHVKSEAMPTVSKKTVEFPALKPYIAARQLPLTPASNAPSIQQAALPPTKIISNSQARENFNRLIGLESKIMKREGEVPPPNTPATPSGPGSPTSKSSRSRAGSVAFTDDDDDLCGITGVCRQLPMYPPQLKKMQLDLLGSIDEFLRENTEADDDLICMSPPKNALRLIDEDEDLLVI